MGSEIYRNDTGRDIWEQSDDGGTWLGGAYGLYSVCWWKLY